MNQAKKQPCLEKWGSILHISPFMGPQRLFQDVSRFWILQEAAIIDLFLGHERHMQRGERVRNTGKMVHVDGSIKCKQDSSQFRICGTCDRNIEKRLEIVPGRLGVVGEVQCGAGHQYFKAKDSLSLKSLPRVGMFRSHFCLMCVKVTQQYNPEREKVRLTHN